MAQIIPRPKLNPEARYALEDTNSKGWLANSMPLTLTANPDERKEFSGVYLNDTRFEWWYSHRAVELAPETPTQRPAPRPKAAVRPAPRPSPTAGKPQGGPKAATGSPKNESWAPGKPVPEHLKGKKFVPKAKYANKRQ